jgi:ketosteroid isomerase-like protein
MGTNSDLLRAGYEAWNRDDCDAWIALLHPEVEIRTSGLFPDLAAVYQGHRRAKRFWTQLREPWERFRIAVEEMEEAGDWVAAGIRFRATGVDSGVDVDMPFGHAIRVTGGLAVEFVTRRTAEEALEALPDRHIEPVHPPDRLRQPR